MHLNHILILNLILISWISRHVKDEYVKNSKNEGFRARSAFKLQQILEKFGPLKKVIQQPEANVIDLGAAPGSWSQVLAQNCSDRVKIVAIDRLPIVPLTNVISLCLDFTSSDAFDVLVAAFSLKTKNTPFVNLLLSDLCANITGNTCVDNANNFHLWQQAFNFSNLFLSKNGHFVIKIFESKEAEMFRRTLKNSFKDVFIFKPKASRSESSEKYFICLFKR